MKLMFGNPPEKTTSPSVVTDAGGDPRGNAKKRKRNWEKRANDSKPKGDHNVFTHFPNDPNCEACPMTKTTRPDAKTHLSKAPMGPHLQPHSENKLLRTTKS